MRRLLPSPEADVDPLDAYVGADRPSPEGRPWVAVVMVTSLDGATAVDGVSGDLGGAADRRVFHATRAMADVILAGAGTVRAENYGPVLIGEAAQAARRRHGLSPGPARLAVVSGSLDLDPGHRMFDGPPPIVFTTESSARRRGSGLEGRAEVVACGDGSVDLVAAMAELSDRGARVVSCEGGPALAGNLIESDLVDEWCVNIAATAIGGPSRRVAHGSPPVDLAHDLASVLVEDDLLAIRWVRRR